MIDVAFLGCPRGTEQFACPSRALSLIKRCGRLRPGLPEAPHVCLACAALGSCGALVWLSICGCGFATPSCRLRYLRKFNSWWCATKHDGDSRRGVYRPFE